MTRKALIPVLSLAGMVGTTVAYPASLTIKVVDEHNTGVYSQVYYDDGTQPPSFLNTDQLGQVPQPPQACGKMRTLYAHPFDSGAYFDSSKEPCALKVVLHVLSRQTPIGKAINFEVIPFNLPDGSTGVITLKAALEATSLDKHGFGERPQCEIKLKALADQNVFKIDGDNWIGVKQAITAFSNVFSGAKQPDIQTVTFPYSCNATGDRFQTLQTFAADRVDMSVNKDSVMVAKTIRSLGLQ